MLKEAFFAVSISSSSKKVVFGTPPQKSTSIAALLATYLTVWHQYANLVFLMFGSLKDYRISMAGSRSDLIYRYSCTCDKCTRSTAAVEAAAAGALGVDRTTGSA